MATNSILHSIIIRDKRLANSFVNAVENSKNKKAKHVTLSKSVKALTIDQIKEIFG